MIKKYEEFLLEKKFNLIVDKIILVEDLKSRLVLEAIDNLSDNQIKNADSNVKRELKKFLSNLPKEQIKSFFYKLVSRILKIKGVPTKTLILKYTLIFLTFVSFKFLFSGSKYDIKMTSSSGEVRKLDYEDDVEFIVNALKDQIKSETDTRIDPKKAEQIEKNLDKYGPFPLDYKTDLRKINGPEEYVDPSKINGPQPEWNDSKSKQRPFVGPEEYVDPSKINGPQPEWNDTKSKQMPFLGPEEYVDPYKINGPKPYQKENDLDYTNKPDVSDIEYKNNDEYYSDIIDYDDEKIDIKRVESEEEKVISKAKTILSFYNDANDINAENKCIIQVGKFSNVQSVSSMIDTILGMELNPSVRFDYTRNMYVVGVQFLYRNENEIKLGLDYVRKNIESNSWVLRDKIGVLDEEFKYSGRKAYEIPGTDYLEGIIIIGQFTQPENLEYILIDLINNKYKPYTNINPRNGFTMVGVQFEYKMEKDLRKVLEEIQKKYDEGSWVLKGKLLEKLDKNSEEFKREVAQKLVNLVEGGYSTDKKDTGNYTNLKNKDGKLVKTFIGTKYGISAGILKKWRGGNITANDMKTLTYKEAMEIYTDWYWKGKNLDKIKNQNIINIIYDGIVNQGYSERGMISILRNAFNKNGLNIKKSESPLSEKVIENLNRLKDQKRVFEDIKAERLNAYRKSKTAKAHLKGWENRLKILAYFDY